MYTKPIKPNELYHYGVLGMRWGVRRYQNYDGTRIGAGKPPVTNGSKVKTQNLGTGKVVRNSVSKLMSGTSVATGKGINAPLAARAGGAKGGSSNNNSSNNGNNEEQKPKSMSEAILGPSVKKGKGKDDTSIAQETLKGAERLIDNTKDIAKTLKEIDPKVKKETARQEKASREKVKKMSDKELRDSINRIKMEREYQSLTRKETQTGYDKAVDILDKSKPFIKAAAEIAGLVILILKAKSMMGHSDMSDTTNEIYTYCIDNGFDANIVEHAINLDLDYILDYYDLDPDVVQHIMEDNEEELYHHGILGMKWGVRRFQNYDGTRIKGGTPGLPSPSSLGSGGVGSGVGGGGGGSSASNSFRKALNKMELKGPKKETPFAQSLVQVNNSVTKKDNIKNRSKEYEKDLKRQNDAVATYWTEVEKAGGYDGPNGKNSRKAYKIAKNDIYHKKLEKTRKLLEKDYSRLKYKDIDEDMIRIGQEYNLNNKYLKEMWIDDERVLIKKRR